MTTAVRGARSRFRPYERALFVRQIIVTVLPVACYFLRPDDSSVRAILYLSVAATALNFLYYALHIKGAFPQSLRWGRLALDIVLWTLFMSYTDGPASVFFLGYLVEILIAAIADSETGCLVAAALAAVAYLGLVVREPDALAWEQALSRLLTLLVAGFLCRTLIRKLDERRREESEELRSRLARAEDLGRLGEAAAGVAHEVRNTAHGLSGFLSLLKDDLAIDSRGRSIVGLIESGVKGMNDLADEVLDASKGSGPARSRVDLREVIRESVAFATQGWPPRGIDFTIEETTSVHAALANREALRGAFVNLINNALQASPAGGKILIKISGEGHDTIRVDISDTGPGIPAALRDRIFDPLVTTRAEGTGLGLAISRRAIESCGGSLHLTSTGAAGTTMTVRLPAHRVPHASQARGYELATPISRSARSR